ncbi:MAG TPA: WD40 repeat domain-containing protein [Xanthobacteraceae bacterium]|jgi:WD40 repeat protein|nr:WD40 repeat domain-containing protein [Xanthobacteraceae bacterium]
MAHENTPSLVSQVKAIDAGSHVAAAAFLGDSAAFALGEGEVLVAGESERRIRAHEGAILEAASDGARLFTAGDDGRVAATEAGGSSETLAEAPGRWIDHLAIGPDGALAWSVGKTAFVRTKKGERALEVPSTVGGLAFAPRGLRLAIAHYNGASLWFPNAEAKPESLSWKGSHLGVQWSPDGRFLVTTMQEPALHGWRVADGQHMRMTGYPARVRSMAFGPGGKWLATSGASEIILWPFASKDGPMGKQPSMLAPYQAKVSAVAAHPSQEVIAAGYEDGLVLLIRLADGAEILVRRPDASPVTALAWSGNGQQLAFGTETGSAGLVAL